MLLVLYCLDHLHTRFCFHPRSNCPSIQHTNVWCFHSHWSSYSLSLSLFFFSKEHVFPIPKVKEATFLWKVFACYASFVSHALGSQGPLNLNANCQNKLLIPSKRQQKKTCKHKGGLRSLRTLYIYFCRLFCRSYKAINIYKKRSVSVHYSLYKPNITNAWSNICQYAVMAPQFDMQEGN